MRASVWAGQAARGRDLQDLPIDQQQRAAIIGQHLGQLIEDQIRHALGCQRGAQSLGDAVDRLGELTAQLLDLEQV